jgi:putative transposase
MGCRHIKNNSAHPIDIPFKENDKWIIDFLSDNLINGRRIRTLNIVDHITENAKG